MPTWEWILVAAVAVVAVVAAIVLFFARNHLLTHDIEITLVDAPKAAPQAVEHIAPGPLPVLAGVDAALEFSFRNEIIAFPRTFR